VVDSGDIHDMFTCLDLPLAHELDASAIINATVTGFGEHYHLMFLQFSGGNHNGCRAVLTERR